jgi:hypothetical protein
MQFKKKVKSVLPASFEAQSDKNQQRKAKQNKNKHKITAEF